LQPREYLRFFFASGLVNDIHCEFARDFFAADSVLNGWGVRGGLNLLRPEGAAATAHIIGYKLFDQAPPKA
jgi:hypothetical protein